MDRDAELEVIRRAYAKQIMAACGVSNRRVEAAFASVKREDFLGRGPWQVVRWVRGYVPTPSRNPVYLYDDVVVAIIPERHLNNGQPSLHAALIASAAPRLGEHVVHVGAGVGYYTAILHRLVGRQGRVTAIEFDAGLAMQLAANFAGVRNINVVHGDGARVPFDSGADPASLAALTNSRTGSENMGPMFMVGSSCHQRRRRSVGSHATLDPHSAVSLAEGATLGIKMNRWRRATTFYTYPEPAR
jgi:protein-L-isoaspartate O-methyltransferase